MDALSVFSEADVCICPSFNLAGVMKKGNGESR
jgi:hypothetical protein